MTTQTGVRGLVDFALMEFDDDDLTRCAALKLIGLHDRGVIQVLHLVVVGKGREGDVYAADLGNATPDRARGFASSAGARTNLLGDNDLRAAAGSMKAGHLAVLVVYRITPTLLFDKVAKGSNGQILASGRVPAENVDAVLSGIGDIAP